MLAFKKIYNQDVTYVPYTANKQWDFSFNSFPTSSEYITIYVGINATGSFSSGSDPVYAGQYERMVYNQINQLFYQTYTASLNTSSLASSIYYISASEQRSTASYFIYNSNDNFVKYFPTGANEEIRVISVKQDVYGNKILPNSFVLSSSVYYITDDGNGNLYDNTTHVGNIFYAHGLGIITNQDYQNIFPT